jgi:16S rRNA (cytosine967-C5)-methyltransferase
MSISPARQAAFTILVRVERESAYAVELLHSGLLDTLSPLDRNLATELVMGVLRWRSVLDQSIARLSFTPFRKLDLEVLTALRMGVYQKQFLEKIPAHAAVNETVELVKQSKKSSAAGLVNAVMRKIKRGPAPASSPAQEDSLVSSLAHPSWLTQRWTKNFGPERARLICEYDQRVPRTALRLLSLQSEAELAREGLELAPGALLESARVVVSGDITSTQLFRGGRVAIQDEGSQLVAALVGAGKRILDCCAAPGGKTGALATRLPEAEIFAVELHPHRARLLRRMAPQSNVHVVTADALALPFAAEFDRVLADVPCSGTGTLARNPEIKWRLQPGDLAELQAKQISILAAAMQHVAPGGRMVYSTCSLEPEENEQVVAACLERHPEFSVVPVAEELRRLQREGELAWNDIDGLITGDFLRTIPGVHPCDGFFAAVLEKHEPQRARRNTEES